MSFVAVLPPSRQRSGFVLISMLILPNLLVLADDQVIYPAAESANDVRHDDKLELLTGALERTRSDFGGYTLAPAPVVMNKARQFASLERGMALTVIWSATSQELEDRFLPVRIPLRKGLLGYKIALIPHDKQPFFDNVHSLEDLKKVVIGTGNGWVSTDVFKNAGLTVSVSNYESLFKLTALGRIDMFPRGLNEVFAEYEANKKELPTLAIEQRLVLYYPNAYYFFVGKTNTRLARRLEQGLRTMIKDGSFDAIFWRYNGDAIREAKLHQRRFIEIIDRSLPPATPLKEKNLWFDPTAPRPGNQNN
ncbi:transporter substrate-binding domain-containing protein [Chitinivorax sp. B]|uniref:substrate-binding periplasmic protein n=1 Tax=Chitinivorax sp. B TaxID=2502235 RepID=UPI0010F66953|nr:transporter substrate-binding domain-containing protein [Chitinivorax sp. B]